MKFPGSCGLVVVLLCAGCPSTQTPVCPTCPAGTTCDVPSGTCLPDAMVDMSTNGGDMAMSMGTGCNPICGGLTPKCNGSNHCVGCAVSADCALGQLCHVVSPTSASCVSGCTDDTRCAMGEKCCNAMCVNVATDPNNCGACGTTCAAAHAPAACTAGACALGTCKLGWGDCNMNPKDGCETNLHTDPMNCTACGMTCAIAGAINACADGCYEAACQFGFADCDMDMGNGCETPVSSDPANCGGCGMACKAPPNALAGCQKGNCILSSCNLGFTDCNNNPMDGCEANLLADSKNCGGCGNVCPMNLPGCLNGNCVNTTHDLAPLATDAKSVAGCGDSSNWIMENLGMMTWDQCEAAANKYGAQYIGSPNLSGITAPYALLVRWAGEASASNAYITTQNWSQVTSVLKSSQQNCVLGYANGPAFGQVQIMQQLVSTTNGKTYNAMDFGVMAENACYTKALASGARPLNPVSFGVMGIVAHMIENHSCHGSIQYSGNSFAEDGNTNHNYHCFIGYNP